MGDLQMILQAVGMVFTPLNIAMIFGGLVLGMVVGCIPGLSVTLGIILLLPLTYKFNPTTAIIMLGALYYANMYGGSFSAILLNIPGDSPAITTALDGYPMARKGRPGQALMTANLSSFIGGTIGIVLGIVMANIITNVIAMVLGTGNDGFVAVPTINGIATAFGVSVAIGILFGYLPANKAAKLNPIDALRYD